MISFEKWMILAPLQKLPMNVGDLGKLIVAKAFKKLPKVQKITNSGHIVKWRKSLKLLMLLFIRLECWMPKYYQVDKCWDDWPTNSVSATVEYFLQL